MVPSVCTPWLRGCSCPKPAEGRAKRHVRPCLQDRTEQAAWLQECSCLKPAVQQEATACLPSALKRQRDGCLATEAQAALILMGSGNGQLIGVCTPWLQGCSCRSLQVARGKQCSTMQCSQMLIV